MFLFWITFVMSLIKKLSKYLQEWRKCSNFVGERNKREFDEKYIKTAIYLYISLFFLYLCAPNSGVNNN